MNEPFKNLFVRLNLLLIFVELRDMCTKIAINRPIYLAPTKSLQNPTVQTQTKPEIYK